MATMYSISRFTEIANQLLTLVVNILHQFPLVPGNEKHHKYHGGFAMNLMTNFDVYIYI